MNETTKTVLDALYAGDLKPAYTFKAHLNEEAIRLLELPTLSEMDKEELKFLIDIANITYNNSDRDVLPIEDGVYDMLIEKYRKFNNDVYPVGAAPMVFESNNSNLIDSKEPEPAFRYMTEEELAYRENMLFPEIITRDKVLTVDDFVRPAFSYNEGYISKRTHTVAHNNPELVGTFDKCKYVLTEQARERGVENDSNVRILERDFFGPLLQNGIINPYEELTMIAELKYDGVSVEAMVNDTVEEARSRGDTEEDEAIDMTPILKGYKFPGMYGRKLNNSIGVKFEAIVSYLNMDKLNQMKNYRYINGRTAIIGIMGSSDAFKYRDLITLVPISTNIKDENGEPLDRIEELEFLNRYYTKDQLMRYSVLTGNYTQLLFQMKRFVEEAEFARSYLPFMYDGVVFEFYDKNMRFRLGRDNSIDRYKVAVKFNPLKKQTVFRQYKYTIGQDGSITPMIYYDPVEFYGAIHYKSSGHSYKRFKDLDLHVGDIIDVEYTNDVMPYVTKPDNEHNRKNAMNEHTELDTFPTVCPSCGSPLVVSPSGKTVKCQNIDCANKSLKRMASTFDKLGIVDFGEERIKAVGYNHLWQYFAAGVEDFGILGDTNKFKLKDQLDKIKATPMYDYEFLGSLGFTSIAKKIWKLVFSVCNFDDIVAAIDDRFKEPLKACLANIKGIGPTTAETIVREVDFFKDDLIYAKKNLNILSSANIKAGKQIRFTGCRDKQLEEQLISMGHDADGDSGITKSTDILLVPTDGYNSGRKIEKAKSYGIRIIPIKEFKNNMDQYL